MKKIQPKIFLPRDPVVTDDTTLFPLGCDWINTETGSKFYQKSSGMWELYNKPLTIDAYPTLNSANAVQSGGVFNEIRTKAETLTLLSITTAPTVVIGGAYFDLSSGFINHAIFNMARILIWGGSTNPSAGVNYVFEGNTYFWNGYKLVKAGETDNYYNKNRTPYANMAEVISQIPIVLRKQGLTVNIGGVEYWWETANMNIEPVLKITNSQISKWEPMVSNTTLHPRWIENSFYGTDKFNFNSIPSGYRDAAGNFKFIGERNLLYTQSTGTSMSFFYMANFHQGLNNIVLSIQSTTGINVRCLKNANTTELLLPDGTIIDKVATDYDGNEYSGTKIGTQVWLRENLKTTHYNNGDLIPTNLSNTNWGINTTGAMAIYGKKDGDLVPFDELTDIETIKNTYGCLYNGYATKLGIEPSGTLIPTDSDWLTLKNYIKGLIVTVGFNSPNDVIIDETNIGAALKSDRQINTPFTGKYFKPKDNKRIDASIIDNLPKVDQKIINNSKNAISNEAVYEEFLKKENKNNLINNFYVTTITELIAAWNSSVDSLLPTNIYVAGTITLTGPTVMNLPTIPSPKAMSIIGLPSFSFNLAGFPFTTYGKIENVSFTNPSSSGYIQAYGGSLTLKNVTFTKDVIDTDVKIKHVNIVGVIKNGTGKIIIDGVTHFTAYSSDNLTQLIQPICIHNTLLGFTALYIVVKNVDALLSFDRFSRVLLTADQVTPFKVTGDTSWFYSPSQIFSGGNISSTAEMYKGISVDDIKIDQTKTDNSVTRLLGVDINNKVKITQNTIRFEDIVYDFGKLYSFDAVNTGKLAPTGWSIPTYAQWQELDTFVASDYRKLRESGTNNWKFDVLATNETGFTAVPGGMREWYADIFVGIFELCRFWSSTPGTSGAAYFWDISNSSNGGNFNGSYGLSIRCVRNTDPGVSTVIDNDGYEYDIVKIGTQWWTKQNLRTTCYNDGQLIPDGLSWAYNNDSTYVEGPTNKLRLTNGKKIESSQIYDNKIWDYKYNYLNNYTVTLNDYTIDSFGADIVITLLSAIGNIGKMFNIKNSNTSDNITVNTTASQKIDQVTSIVLLPGEILRVQSTGKKWIKL